MKMRVLLAGLLTPFLFTGCGDKPKESQTKDHHAAAPTQSSTLFKLLSTEESGIDFSNSFTEETELLFYNFQYLFNGGGVAVADFDQDGLPDIFFSGNEVSNRIYRNLGNLKFEDLTQKAGVGAENEWCTGVTVADVNNDGLPDLYVSKSGYLPGEERKNRLYINKGDFTFSEEAESYGIADSGYTTQSAFFDFDLDGDLDLYVLNHKNTWKGDRKLSRNDLTNNLITADHLYRNDGGKFTDVSKSAGLKNEIFGGYGLGLAVGDLDGNGYPDVYVSNDYDSPDFMYMNQGDGTFKDEIKERTSHIALYSMGNDIADFNNDGLLDFIALDMSAEDHFRLKTQMGAMAPKKFYELVEFGLPHQYMYNTLQVNNGNGTFSDIGQLAGVHSTDWSWAPLFADFDNDGYKDLFVSNGYRLDDRDNDYQRKVAREYGTTEQFTDDQKKTIFRNTPSTPLPNYVFKNNGDFTFTKKSYEWGVAQKGFTQGTAFADFDRDGDLDLVMNNMNERAWLYQNTADQSGKHFLNVSLKSDSKNPIGAQVEIETQDGIQLELLNVTRGYISSMNDLLHFGLGDQSIVDRLTVTWPDGKTQTLTNIKGDQILTLDYKDAARSANAAESVNPLFAQNKAAGIGLDFKHVENPFDDFEKEILLPHRNSQHGPGMSVGDINGDGLDDIYVGGAMNQAGQLFVQNENGKFSPKKLPAFISDKKSEDVGSLFYDYDKDGDLDLYVASGGNEYAENAPELQDRLYTNDGKGNFTKSKGVLPTMLTSGKSVSAGDFDADGDLDLFVGGRLVPGKYPFAPRSYILRYEDGKYVDATNEVAPDLYEPGLVTNSMWVDYDGDNDLDLMVVGEWMPLLLMTNDGGKLSKLEEGHPFHEETGWWSGLEAGDFDNDGDLDFVVGNLGLNYKYKTSPEEPFQIWCHDFDANGTLDIVLGYFDHGGCYPVRGRQCSSQQMPFIKDKFPTYNDFASATIEDVYGKQLKDALNYKATRFSSVYIENLGGNQFKIKNLPQRAQFSIVHSIIARDFDGDHNLDIVVSGNLYSSEVETPRNDASIGTFLKGDGKSGFDALPYSSTGYYTPGDVKDVKLVKTAHGKYLIVSAVNNDFLQVLSVLGTPSEYSL
ncbi:VCBS repeat-containing protein [bacterium SCSIO 12741]|nr:VCBS repeat-containing protein [bacterium SCSIO 12741]